MMLCAVMMTMFLQAPTPIDTVARGSDSNVAEPRQAVVRSADEWTTLWRAHAGHTPAPPVDFKTRIVLAVFLGTRPSAGYAVEIIRTRPDGAGLVVEYAEREPERGMVAAQILTSPAHIVSVPRTSGPIRFEKAGQ